MRRLPVIVCAAWVALVVSAAPAAAQGSLSGRGPFEVHGFGLFGNISFTASDSFDAVLDTSSGPLVGGGGRVTLPLGIFVEVSAAQFKRDGERVFVSTGGNVFKLGIPAEITVTPLEVTGGWRFRNLTGRVVPYVGGGWSSYGYKETSNFAQDGENVDERFSGFHLLGGADVKVLSWLNVGGEVAWSSIPDALGDAGVSAFYRETDLGGTSLRLKISVGR